jgi:hypothetical protein
MRPGRSVAIALTAGSLMTLLGGCVAGAGSAAPAVSSVAPASAPAASSAPVVGGIQPVLVSTQAWPGLNRILVTIEDAQNRDLTAPDLTVRGTLREVDRSAAAVSIETPGRFVRAVAGGRGLIEFDVTLPRVGRWRLDVEAVPSGASALTGSTELVVRPDGDTPAVGSAAPTHPTPTARDVGYDLTRLTSDPIPEKSLYWLSASEALKAGQPFVLVLDSFKFKVSESCGGALGIVRHLGEAYPTVSFMHAEPYLTSFAGGELTLDPAVGPPRLAPWSEAWGIDVAPWVFVVDGSGIVRAKFSGVFGTEELRMALRSVAGWTPTT